APHRPGARSARRWRRPGSADRFLEQETCIMWFPALLLSLVLARKPRAGRRQKAHRAPTPQRRRLHLEPLEDRCVPSTFTVSNLNDAGPGSLRQAVLAANASPGADVIAFSPAVRGTLTLTSGELAVSDDLTISGPGAGRLTVSGNHASRVFDVSAAQASISGRTGADGLAIGRPAPVRRPPHKS